jgi:hypothetical protein
MIRAALAGKPSLAADGRIDIAMRATTTTG